MKYVVTVETEVEFKFLPHVNKDELLKEFCECIFETDMEGLERFIAERISVGDYNFIEGVGRIIPKWQNISGYSAQAGDYVLEYETEFNSREVELL